MKKSIVAMGLAALVSTGALAHKHNYGVSVYDDYSRLPFAGKLAASNNQKLVQSLFPGFHAVTDKLSGAPKDIYGKTLAVPGNSLTQKSQYLLNNQLRQFEIVASDWKQTNEVNAPHAGFTHYKQFINGREVVFSQISFRFTKDGLLQRAVIKSYGQPQSGVTPTLTQADIEYHWHASRPEYGKCEQPHSRQRLGLVPYTYSQRIRTASGMAIHRYRYR